MVQIAEEIELWKDKFVELWPEMDIISIPCTSSTNQWLKDRREEWHHRTVLVITDYQTAGRGSGTNHWESQEGMNLTFSLQVCPTALVPNHMFALSEAMSLGVCMGLQEYIGRENADYRKHVRIKWPNDVYYADGKICGMLIENDLQSHRVDCSVIGVGININQNQFLSGAPNPTSLNIIMGQHIRRMEVLEHVIRCFRHYYQMIECGDFALLHTHYLRQVYRMQEWHTYVDGNGPFEGKIINIQSDGHLIMLDSSGNEHRYAFGEIKYIIQ